MPVTGLKCDFSLWDSDSSIEANTAITITCQIGKLRLRELKKISLDHTTEWAGLERGYCLLHIAVLTLTYTAT